ncbi:Uma2 family endonuclease [Phormidium sp. LEGE 05292]|uniref:Uma2 family endonuclease n=1 Tax=[Phormidium] sp. LEGE 05292 TaxID=767427 RepID=UPI00188164F5|nr:Uma2 family endonuclease [Phormidium sp. LEGE 05292]MBE9228552.1 Uma2 family endonuclease [Phormidium sp. LEGE 05292]
MTNILETISPPEITPLVLQMSPAIEMTDEQFFNFCQQNRNYHIERTANGEITIIPPTGSETGNRNFDLIVQLGIWTRQNGTGIGFDSSAGFTLPNGAIKSSDAAWIKLEKWQSLTSEQQQKFAPICPDFIVELRSPSDNLQTLKDKLQEYIDNGTSLGLLIDRKNRQVYIYRPNSEIECLDNPATINCQPLLPGFILDLSTIW